MGEFFEYFSLVEGVNLGGNPEFGHSRSCPRGVTNFLRVIMSKVIALPDWWHFSAADLRHFRLHNVDQTWQFGPTGHLWHYTTLCWPPVGH